MSFAGLAEAFLRLVGGLSEGTRDSWVQAVLKNGILPVNFYIKRVKKEHFWFLAYAQDY